MVSLLTILESLASDSFVLLKKCVREAGLDRPFVGISLY